MTETIRYFDRCDVSHGLFFDATALLHHSRSDWQDIKILETERHGRVMLLDDVTMLTQSTHHVYHEHMVHIPMACLAVPKQVLVIGGGDGGTVTELVRYPGLEAITLCELDGAVIEVSREWLPDIASGLADPRVEIRIGDGAAYLAANPGRFDLIIIDSTDICDDAHGADAIANPLASNAFYAAIKAGLKPGGAAMQMLGSPTFYTANMARMFQRVVPQWQSFKPVMMPCPFYISGDWCAGLLSEVPDLMPTHAHDIRGPLKYFNMDIARAALALPNEVQRLLPNQE
ncbi:MAG: hypothetical protein AAF253_02695 [Pseudomonadota bacterium]